METLLTVSNTNVDQTNTVLIKFRIQVTSRHFLNFVVITLFYVKDCYEKLCNLQLIKEINYLAQYNFKLL